MNVIIIAVIALIVLIVLILIFTGQLQNFTSGLKSCPSVGGTCTPGEGCIQNSNGKFDCSCPEGKFKMPNGECPTNQQVCCKELIKSTS